MQRRSLLKLGIASAAALGLLGGTAALLEPGLVDGRLGPGARTVFTAVSRGILQGTLPTEDAAQQRALDGLLQRVDALVGGLPPHAQQELSQLLALLASTPGRTLFARLPSPWGEASIAQVQAALQSMRVSSVALRQQAYLALHDIVSGAYFTDPATWATLGYPGPQAV